MTKCCRQNARIGLGDGEVLVLLPLFMNTDSALELARSNNISNKHPGSIVLGASGVLACFNKAAGINKHHIGALSLFDNQMTRTGGPLTGLGIDR